MRLRVFCPSQVTGAFLSVVPVCLASLSAYRVWFCAAVVKQSGLVFSSVVVNLASLQSVFYGWVVVLAVVAGGFSQVVAGFVSLAKLVFPRCAAVLGSGFFEFGSKCPLSMPNKPVKGTARHSGWQSWFFSQVSGFAVGNQRAAPYRNVGLAISISSITPSLL